MREKIIHESALLSSNTDDRKYKKEISQLTGGDFSKGQSVKIEYSSVIKNNEPEQHASPSIAAEGEHINFKDILKLPASYWLLIIVATLAETLFIPFLDNGNKYYVQVFKGIE
jgi:hypothetical protein